MNSLSVIIPCYNAEKFIASNIKRLINKVQNKKILYEIILVNDGSTDNTLHELRKLKKKRLKIISYKKNLGKSYAIRKALKIAKYKTIIFIDCDLPYFNKLDLVIKKLRLGYDFVGIDRRHKKSKIITKNLKLYQHTRIILSYLLNRLISYFLKFDNLTYDTQSGLKGFKNIKVLKNKKFISNRFFLDLELINFFYINKLSFCFIPVNYKSNSTSSIKILSFKNIQILTELFFVLKYIKNFKINNK